MDQRLSEVYSLESEQRLEIMALSEPHQGVHYGPLTAVPIPNHDMAFEDWKRALSDLVEQGFIRVSWWPTSRYDFARVERVYRS